MDDMNNIYSEKDTSIIELLDENYKLSNNHLLMKLVKIEVGNYLLKFEMNKVLNSKKKMIEFIENLLLELDNKVHPKLNEKVRNNILYGCQLYSSPEMFYENITELYGEYDEDIEDNEKLVSLANFIVPDDEYEEEEDGDSSYNPEEEYEEEEENDTENFEELKDNLESNGIFLRGNRIIIKRNNKQKLDDLDRKFMDLTQGKQYNSSDLDYFQKLDNDEKNKYIKMLGDLNKFNGSQKPLMIQVMDFDTTLENKNAIIKKLKQYDNINPFSSEYSKLKKWVDTVLRVPFGKYHNYPVKKSDSKVKINNYIKGIETF